MAKAQVWRELAKSDIQFDRSKDFVVLKGQRFNRPDITAIALNNDPVTGDGFLGSIRLAQTVRRQYSPMTGLPKVEEEIFVVRDDAGDVWSPLKEWLKEGAVQVVETTIPNAAFTELFGR